jgi:hypothetical protein
MSNSIPKKHPGFCFDINASVHLEVDEIWPDGDAPENPTAEDVEVVIQQAGGLRRVLRDWDLEDHIILTVSDSKTFAEVVA